MKECMWSSKVCAYRTIDIVRSKLQGAFDTFFSRWIGWWGGLTGNWTDNEGKGMFEKGHPEGRWAKTVHL